MYGKTEVVGMTRATAYTSRNLDLMLGSTPLGVTNVRQNRSRWHEQSHRGCWHDKSHGVHEPESGPRSTPP